MYRGPVLLNDLCGTLIRFRLNKIGVVADIEKAFLQISLQVNQRDVTRFLWLKDPENSSLDPENLQEYRFCRVPFGIISSPFLLGATVEHHLSSYDTELARQLKRDIYMDNVVSGVKSIDEASEFYKEAKQIFCDASMNLREWASNEEVFIQTIPKEDRADEEMMKVLGLFWDKIKDTLQIKQLKILTGINITKRTVLKQVASVFDPLGFFSPVTVKGKLLLQRLWSKHAEWDDPVDEEDSRLWSTIQDDLISVSTHKLPRFVGLVNEQVENFLVCFCDASSRAYAAVIYLVQHGKDAGKAELIFAKTRLAPTTATTIPRLELMAVLIGVRCVHFVQTQLSMPVNNTYLFTDSQCTLKWLSTTKRLSVFVNNRVKEIKSHRDIQFHYVDTKTNPADVASRGCSAAELTDNTLWWHGPEWLVQPVSQWHLEIQAHIKPDLEFAFESEVKSTRKEGEESILLNEETETKTYMFPSRAPFDVGIERFSSLHRLLRVTAMVLMFLKKLKRKVTKTKQLTSEEVQEAEEMWIKHTQRNHFQDIFQSITSDKRNNLQRQLGVYVDSTGILRCKGRLENAGLTEAARFPVLLPKNDRFTSLVIESVHKKNLHTGVSQTLSAVRHHFWIPHGRAAVRKVVSNCGVCRRYEGGPYKTPSMAPLPRARVSESVPFSHTGMDYMGPLYIKEDQQTKKVWVCIFTCMVTRAVHLELVSNMSTNAFLNCLRRFIATRGKPIELVCDNAMHFKLACETTELIWKNVVIHEDVQSYCSNEKIKWSFIVELAPWMGGFYERLVGVIKRALRKAIGRNLLDNDRLHTVLKESEAVVNSRPLVYVGDDINSTIVITPGHFTCLNPKTGIVELDIHAEKRDPDFSVKKNFS